MYLEEHKHILETFISGFNGNWYYCSNYYDVSINKYGVKCETSLGFWENNGWINKIDPYGWFQ